MPLENEDEQQRVRRSLEDKLRAEGITYRIVDRNGDRWFEFGPGVVIQRYVSWYVPFTQVLRWRGKYGTQVNATWHIKYNVSQEELIDSIKKTKG